MFKFFLKTILFVLFILTAIVLYNTLTSHSLQLPEEKVGLPSVSDKSVDRLSDLLKIPTVSKPFAPDTLGLKRLQTYLDSNFTAINGTLKRTRVNRYSLLYVWQGRNKSLLPVLLMAHQDVVPVAEDTRSKWSSDPFGGVLQQDGFIYGRGTMDDKSSLAAIMEAVELLAQQGFQPERTIYLLFGHDEEVGGRQGALPAAEAFRQAGIKFEYILDEGMTIVEGALPGINKPVALIGLTEKGYLTLNIKAKGEGGHSSMPPRNNAVGLLSKAIADLEEEQMPATMKGIPNQLFDYVGPEMSFGYKMMFANRWLFGGLLKSQMLKSASSNALLRTTTAPTMLESGVAENVLPTEANATINFRIRPGETTDDVIKHVQEVIGTEHFEITNGPTVSNPPHISPTDAYGFRVVQHTISQVFPEVLTAPSMVLGATDARHFEGLSDCIYRFAPNLINKDDFKRVHGIDERINANHYKRMIQFYYQLLKNTAGAIE